MEVGILQVKKLRLREVKLFSQGHTAEGRSRTSDCPFSSLMRAVLSALPHMVDPTELATAQTIP